MGMSPATDLVAAPALDLNSSAFEYQVPSATGLLDSVSSGAEQRPVAEALNSEAATEEGFKEESSVNSMAGRDSIDGHARAPPEVVERVRLDQDAEPGAVDGRSEVGVISSLAVDRDGVDAPEGEVQFSTLDGPGISFTSGRSEIKLLNTHDERPVVDASMQKNLEHAEKQTTEAEAKASLRFNKGTESTCIKLDERPCDGSDAANVVVGDGYQMSQPGEQEQPKSVDMKTRRLAGIKQRTSVEETDQHGRYELSGQEDKVGFSVSDLVWGKVRSHPWWPGQIYDPKDASEMAAKIQKKGHFLVAYFGDKTFAWCEESQLKPFELYFSQMEKQSSTDAFVNAVNAALEEASRRIDLGMTCSCVPEEAYIKPKEQKVENAGIREGVSFLAVDRSEIAGCFQPDKLIDFIQALAVFPSGGTDRLDFVTAKSQLKTFYLSKHDAELPLFLLHGQLLESDAEISPLSIKRSWKDVINQTTLTLSGMTIGKSKPRSRRSSSSKIKNLLEDGRKKKRLSELMEDRDVLQFANDRKSAFGVKSAGRSVSRSGKKHKVVGVESGKRKRKRLDSLGDLEAKMPYPSVGRFLKVGNSIRRVARKMTGSPSIFNSETKASQRSSAKVVHRRSHVGTNDTPGASVETGRRKRGVLGGYPTPSEVLSQLFLAARDPMKGYSFLSVIVSFFTDFRASVASEFSSSSSKDKKHVERSGSRKGRKKLANSKSLSSKMYVPNYMQDSYWSDIIFQCSPKKEPLTSGQKRKGQSQAKKQKKKKKKTAGKLLPYLPSVPLLNASQETKVFFGNPETKEDVPQISNSGERADGCTPTALILSFTESGAVPSEMDLVNVFSRYGPLNESETEVLRNTNRAKVVFKKHADADVAFNSAEKYNIFGPALVSYRLKYLPSTPEDSPNSMPQGKKNISTIEGIDLEAAAEEETGVASDNTQVESMAQRTSE